MIKSFSVLLLLVFICTCQAETITIETLDEFKAFGELSRKDSFNFDVNLSADINMTEETGFMPFGLKTDLSCNLFSGTFNGNGHTISGLVIQGTNSALFCGLDGATINDLTLSSTCSFSGTQASGLSISAKGTVVISKVKSYAEIRGKSLSAGFIATISNTESSNIRITDSLNAGNVISVRDSKMDCHMGGFVGEITSNSKSNVLIENSVNDGKLEISSQADGGVCVGGFVGIANDLSGSTSVAVRNCVNNGNMVVNTKKTARVGGLFGNIYMGRTYSVELSDCINNGNIDCTGQSQDGSQGGLVGYISKGRGYTMKMCEQR